MPPMLKMLLMLTGMVIGGLLFQLPVRLFYRHSTWLTEEEFLKAHSNKWWVSFSMYVLLPLGFLLSVILLMTTDINQGSNWLFFFPVFFTCISATVAIPELVAQTGIQIPVGHNSRSPAMYAVSPQAVKAAIFRLVVALVVVGSLLYFR